MVSMSQFVPDYQTVFPKATFTSEPWAIAAASFRPIALGVDVNNTVLQDTTISADLQTLTGSSAVLGATQKNLYYRGAIVTAILGTVSATGSATLLMQMQFSPDNGTTWISYGSPTSAVVVVTGNAVSVMVYPTALVTTLGTGAAGIVLNNAPMPKTWRMTYTPGGVAVSIVLSNVTVNYLD